MIVFRCQLSSSPIRKDLVLMVFGLAQVEAEKPINLGELCCLLRLML